jgi:sodium/potassium/calcium exchanger 6
MFAPIMGFSACFGGPMLNILLGIGISGTYMTHHSSKPYVVDFSPALVTSAVALLLLLVSTLLFVPLNDFSLTKRWGIFLITSYALILVVNVVMELKH